MKRQLAAIARVLPAAYHLDGQDRLLFQRLFWGVVSGCLAAVLLGESPLLETMEYGMLEWRYKVSAELNSWAGAQPLSADVCIVKYDDQSQFDFSAARFDESEAQDKLANVLEVIEQGKPALVAIDLDLRGAVSSKLVDVLSCNQNIVLALFGNFEEDVKLPNPEYVNRARIGYREFVKEANGTVCRLPVNLAERTNNPETTPLEPFIEAVFDQYCKRKGLIAVMPQESDRPCYINFKEMRYPEVSVRDVMAPDFNAKEHFARKAVLIGTLFSPKHGNDPRYCRTPLKNSVAELYVQADALSSLISGDTISSFPSRLSRYLLLCYAAMIGALCSIFPIGARTALTLCSAMILLLVAQVAFQVFHLAMPVVPPLAVLCTGFVLGTVIYLDTDLRVRNRELAEAREAMQRRAEDERQRIAEDLHDETLPALSSVARMADQLSAQLEDKDNVAKAMRARLDGAVSEMRRVINDLHPSVLETMGFVPALENLVSILSQECKAKGDYIDAALVDETGMTDVDLPKFTKLQLYRIVQEGLNNVREHSKASRALVRLSNHDSHLTICVVDNGTGIDKRVIRSDSHGLLNIRQRAQLIGARVEWKKPECFSSGTELRLKINIADVQERKSL